MRALSRSASTIRASVFADLAPRIESRARAGLDLVALHLGDTHRSPPDEARFARVEPGGPVDVELYRYGGVIGLPSLRRAFAARLGASGIGPREVDPERQVLVGCGATHALFCAARAILEPGDEVLVAAPYWPLAVGVLRAAGAVPIEVPLTSRLYADPSLDVAVVFERARTSRTRALYFSTPNNPDGKVLSSEQLSGLARFATTHDLWVIADEVYADYAYEGQHVSIARLDGMADRTASIYSVSKSFGLAGVRVGFAVAPEQVVALARRVGTHTVFNVPVAAQRVALAALGASRSWLDEARRDYRDARDDTIRALEGSGVALFPPEGGSYAFLDFAPVLRGRSLKALLERAIDGGVLVAPGDAFGDAFATWARLCFTAVPRAELAMGIARLRQAIDGK